MIHRKENGQLKAKAGLGIIDNILSTLSNNAISNRAVALEFGEVEDGLSDRPMYPDYTSETGISSGSTISKDGWVQVAGSSGSTGLQIIINGVIMFNGGGNVSYTHYTYSPLLPVKAGDVVSCTGINPVLKYFSNR